VRSQAFLDNEQHPAATFTATGFSLDPPLR
jgi:polyisoprenoid-binding protein YceI